MHICIIRVFRRFVALPPDVKRLQHIQHTATHCNTLQHTSTHCNTLQHIKRTATHCNTLQQTRIVRSFPCVPARYTTPATLATHCNTLQHTATHCNTLPRTTTHTTHTPHCNTLQHTRILRGFSFAPAQFTTPLLDCCAGLCDIAQCLPRLQLRCYVP